MSKATETAARLLTQSEDSHRLAYGGVDRELWIKMATAWIEIARVEALEDENRWTFTPASGVLNGQTESNA